MARCEVVGLTSQQDVLYQLAERFWPFSFMELTVNFAYNPRWSNICLRWPIVALTSTGLAFHLPLITYVPVWNLLWRMSMRGSRHDNSIYRDKNFWRNSRDAPSYIIATICHMLLQLCSPPSSSTISSFHVLIRYSFGLIKMLLGLVILQTVGRFLLTIFLLVVLSLTRRRNRLPFPRSNVETQFASNGSFNSRAPLLRWLLKDFDIFSQH